MESNNPNQTLAVQIVAEFLQKELIVKETADQITKLLKEGKMTEKFWIAAFEKKITPKTTADETESN